MDSRVRVGCAIRAPAPTGAHNVSRSGTLTLHQHIKNATNHTILPGQSLVTAGSMRRDSILNVKMSEFFSCLMVLNYFCNRVLHQLFSKSHYNCLTTFMCLQRLFLRSPAVCGGLRTPPLSQISDRISWG